MGSRQRVSWGIVEVVGVMRDAAIHEADSSVPDNAPALLPRRVRWGRGFHSEEHSPAWDDDHRDLRRQFPELQ